MRLTAHILGGSDAGIRVVRDLMPRYVKLVHAYGQAEELARLVPGLQFIGRVITHPDWSASAFDPNLAAEEDFANVFYQSNLNPLIRIWESGNEIIPSNYQEMAKIAVYDLRFMALCESQGLKASIGNFSTGEPGRKIEPISDAASIEKYWDTYKPALVQARRGGHLLGLHEYMGRQAPDGSYPDETWLQFRYRRLLEWGRNNNLLLPPIFISECGVDRVAGGGPWREQFGDTPEGRQAYTELLVYYELGLRQDGDAVAGAAIFTCGTLGTPQWQPYNIDNTDIPERLKAWSDANPEKPTTPPPPPPPAKLAVGFDASRYQGGIQWELAAQKAQFVFLRATDGTSYLDPFFTRNWGWAKQVKIPRGAYHFFRNGQPWRGQADNFLVQLGTDFGELPPVLDVEDTTAPPAEAEVRAWLEYVEKRTGKRPLIYTGSWYWNPARFGGSLTPWAAQYDLWVANYGTMPAPTLPMAWKTWRFWQYTDKGVGMDFGASSQYIDMDRFNGDTQALALYVKTLNPSGSHANVIVKAVLTPPFSFFCVGDVPLYRKIDGILVYVQTNKANYTINVAAEWQASNGQTYWQVTDPPGTSNDLWMEALKLSE